MATYNRIPIPMGTGKGKAILEYNDRLCRVTMQLQGIGTDKLYKPYLLWEDNFVVLPQTLNIDKSGRCSLRCQTEADFPEKIRAVAVISEDLQPAAIGYTGGEYNWRQCFMMTEDKPANVTEQAQEVAEKPEDNEDETKQAFKSIVCHLSDNLTELKQYANMPELNQSDSLFATHKSVTPFYGCSGRWIKINLRELARVNSLWKYMNNPLVLYACKHYHHLLLGSENASLTLGVPWEYDPDYRLEAGIQGFTDIKPIENTPLKKGVQCYLLLTL
jgi:hypothetical protein